MRPPRLTRAQLADHLTLESPPTRRRILALRKLILRAAPHAAEAIRFNVLCYFHPDAPFGAIGGNICMIESRRGRVSLSFIHGTALAARADPARLLQGRAKSKRFVPVNDDAALNDPRIPALIRAASRLHLDS